MSTPDRCGLLDRDHDRLSIRRQCMLLGVARSGVYRRRAAANDNDAGLTRRIDELSTTWPFLGSRRMTELLRAEGRRVNRAMSAPAGSPPAPLSRALGLCGLIPYNACFRRSSLAEVGMTVYLVGEFEVTNSAGLEPYRRAVNDTIARYGGRFLVRTSTAATTKLLEGGPEPKTIVIIEFPDSTAIERWWNSPEYQRILPIRLQNCTGRIFTVEARG